MSLPAVAIARIEIVGTPVDACTFAEAVERIVERAARGGPPSYVITPNAHHVVLLQESEEFRVAYRGAWLSLADGMSVVWASRLLGTPLPERVSGSDLLPALSKRMAGTGLSIFLLGGRPGSADRTAEVLQARYPGLEIAGTHCPPLGFEWNPEEMARIDEAIRAAKPDLLFVGLGAPKQELWMHRHVARLGVPVAMGVGGSFELEAGVLPRAPRWMRRAGVEWLFRLMVEPRRLWRRYAVSNPRFVALVLRQRLDRR